MSPFKAKKKSNTRRPPSPPQEVQVKEEGVEVKLEDDGRNVSSISHPLTAQKFAHKLFQNKKSEQTDQPVEPTRPFGQTTREKHQKIPSQKGFERRATPGSQRSNVNPKEDDVYVKK